MGAGRDQNGGTLVSDSQNFNPYQPPKAAVEDVGVEQRDIEPASKGLRFGTYIIDMIGYYALSFVTGLMLAIVFGVEWAEGFVPLLVSLAVFFFYYVFFETLWARTPGKFVCRTIVVTEDGGPPSFRDVLIRTLCRFIPFEPFSVLFGERGWHDGISNTRVVPVNR
jgi:uncharacterized RDD family membrane protein YckC